jgi:hypothetical protein
LAAPSFTPTTIDLHLLITNILLLEQVEHCNLKAIFLVVLAFFLKIGLVYPPNPDYLASYLLLPYDAVDSLPFLY